ncbi:MAG: alpha/beta fold hydrolase [Chitinophagales bacterium]
MQLHFRQNGTGFPLIILHGLMGSLDNWQQFSKQMGAMFSVFSVDQRNHGRSPWSNEFNYRILCEDIHEFFMAHQISKAHILGHSMGGKVAMQFAINYPKLVDKLVVVDVAPVAYPDRHSRIFEALLAVPITEISSRADAEGIIRRFLHDEGTIQFLMKGLYRTDEQQFAWRFNLNVLKEKYDQVAAGISGNGNFPGRTLFVNGGNSDYVLPEYAAVIEKYFPLYEVTTIPGAGHWVHAEQPRLFYDAVRNFLES